MADPATWVLSPQLLDRLQQLRPLLELQGCVQAKATGYRLRYREFDQGHGCIVHRTLPVGDSLSAEAVTELIDRWRLEKEAADRATRQAVEREKKADQCQRALIPLIIRAQGGGRRKQRRALQVYDKAASQGLFALWACTLKGEYLKTRKPGRPRKPLW